MAFCLWHQNICLNVIYFVGYHSAIMQVSIALLQSMPDCRHVLVSFTVVAALTCCPMFGPRHRYLKICWQSGLRKFLRRLSFSVADACRSCHATLTDKRAKDAEDKPFRWQQFCSESDQSSVNGKLLSCDLQNVHFADLGGGTPGGPGSSTSETFISPSF